MESIQMKLEADTNMLCRREQTIQLIKAGLYKEALHLLGEWLEAEDSNPEIHNLLGTIYEQKGKLTLALSHYRAAYALDPGYVYARLNLERVTESFVERKHLQPYYGNEIVQD